MLVSTLLFLLGSILNTIAYGSLFPIAAASLLAAIFFVTVKLFGGREEKGCFGRIFNTGSLMVFFVVTSNVFWNGFQGNVHYFHQATNVVLDAHRLFTFMFLSLFCMVPNLKVASYSVMM